MRTPPSRIPSSTGIFTTGNLLCLVLWTDYQGNITTLFILPDPGKMEQVAEVLTPKILTRWNNLPWKRKLKLYLPKFSISGSCNLDQILPKLGITDLFFQQADLIAKPEGVQVVTSSSVTFWSRDNRQALWLNWLFLVVIFSANAQSILFLGKVVNPTKP
ncbi:hypothetical protein Celaphus_00015508, partial [Cervus elaphus hippelaphus]